MAISSKDRKILWARACNKCALCAQPLTMMVGKNNSVVGEECHIVSERKNGPRHRDMETKEYDDYKNFILLCPTHHSIIDDNVEEYSEEILLSIKKAHELEMAKKTEQFQESDTMLLMHECKHTRDVVRALYGAEAYMSDYPVEREDDFELFKEFFELVHDSDVIEELDELSRVNCFGNIVERLHNAGYVILVSNKESYGKYKLSTVFVFIKTKEDSEKYKMII